MKLSKQELVALQCIYEGINSIIYRQDTSEYGVPVIIKLSKHVYPTPRQIVQFANEYALTKGLDLPGIRKAYETGTIDGRPALILDYVEGETVRQAFVAQRKGLAEMLTMAIAIAQALGEIHRHNIIHKNINSHHILVNLERQTATIIDFGIASQIDLKTHHLGIPEVLEGTLAYISPEQTGRMNRSVDYRTDLYSLGVVLYEMLTGKLPFEATDASELVHCHIARRPAPVREVNSDIPEVVSDIVMKLTAKNAEDRYQSAFGLKADLENCLNQLEKTGTVQGFELAKEDFSGRLAIPQKLYGREQEIQTLIQVFERVRRGASEIVLVSGPPGVGKSWLVYELGRFVAEKGGYFVSGNYDQYQRNIPYHALLRAFAELVNLMLTEDADQLAQWKAKILEAVGDNGQVLVEVMPSLEWIIGRQPPVQELSPTEAQQRSLHVSQNLGQTIAQQEHPLVFFIDDLQWADGASLDYLNLLMTDVNNHHLLFIGAYRDDQVGASHPLMQMVKDMEQKALAINTVRLENLSYDTVNLLLSDALRCEPSEAQSLANLVYEKTGGNAFFATEFLQSLYEGGLLTFSFETRRWEWDIARIRDKAVTDDVATLMIHKIETLPENTREMLMLAACIGNTFALKALAAIAAQPAKTAFDHLWQAVEERLVLPLDDNYKVMLAWTDEQPPAMDCHFEFSHSRVRQAAYSLIPTRQKRSVHLAIGRLRLQETEETRLEERIFDIVDHLNEGFRYIQDEPEKLRLAELNLIAGRKAKNAAAYQAAIWYLSMGIGLLPPDKWERYYDLTRNLYTEAVEAEYLSANFERAKLLSEEALQRARDIKDKIRVYKLQILVYRAQNQNVEATEAALAALETLGVLSPTELAYRPLAAAETPALLDTATVIKASHMLSQEIRLEQLLDKMIHIVIENAGAEKGVLIEDKDGRLVIQAKGQVGQEQVETMQATPIEESGEVPLSVVNYVARTQTPVVLSDASRDSTYAADRTIAEHQIRSLLCLPIVHQAKLLGLLYLENNLATNVFTPDRLELLKALSSQAAISMQNANLYASLEEKIRELEQAEQAIKNSEQRLADIINLLPDVTFAIDLDGRVILWNRAAEEFTGVPAGDILGKGDYEYAIPFYGERRSVLIDLLLKPAPEIERLYPSLKREGEMIFGESYTQSARRGEAYLTGVAAPLYDSQGNVIGAIETIHDITERKQAERVLQDSEAHYRAIVEAFDGLIYICSQDHRVEFMNERFIERTGYDGTGELCYKALHDLDFICPWCVNERVFKGETVRWEVQSPKDMRWYYVVDTPIYHADGSMSKQAMILDITERKRAEEALAESEQKYRFITEKMTDAVWLMDMEFKPTFISPSVTRISGYTMEELQALSLNELLTPESFEFAMKTVATELASERLAPRPYERSVTVELEFRRKDGSPLCIESTITLLRDSEGHPTGLMGVGRDITERKQAEEELKKHRDHLEELVQERTAELVVAKEQAEAANRAKSAFLANMSHELRTPLNAILGYAQILQLRLLDADVINALDTIQRSGEHLLTLINDILDIAKIEAGRMELFPAPIHFPNFLEHIASIIRSRAAAKGLTFSFEQLSTLPVGVQADETRLRQVLLNLLDNAVKFTDEGQVTLRVGSREYEVRSKGEKQPSEPLLPTPYSLLRFEVQDTGIGIPPDQMERIFQPFEQVRDVTRQAKGTGLGLAISRQLARLMGGELQVESQPGQGSTFWFDVTLPVTEAAADIVEARDQRITAYKDPRRTVLVVDDVPSNRTVLVDLLQPLGFEVVEAADGQQALHLAQELRPDLILMDRWMPVLDGFEATRQMRQRPQLKEIPVVAISASVSAEDQAQSQEVGIDAFLPKPVNWPRLAALLQEHLGLEWEYEEASAEEKAVLVPPPQEELAVLLDLARRGDMRAIRERAAHIEAMGEQYVPFADKLRELARGFEERQILALIRQYVEKES